MIDTVCLNFPVRLAKDDLSSWGMTRKRCRTGFIVSHDFSVMLVNGAKISYLYFPYIENGLLKVEFSFPTVILGSNVHMIFNIEPAVAQANKMLPNVPGVPALDLWEGIIFRLDVYYDHQVDDLQSYYVKALQDLKYPYRKTLPYTNEGVQYKNGRATTKFYNKEQERNDIGDLVGASFAHGLLRQETTCRKIAVRKLTGNKKPTLRDITIDMLLDALENDLQKLNLLGCSIGTVDTTLVTLTQHCGEVEGIFLYGWLLAKMKHPSKEALEAASMAHPMTIQRRLMKIIEAGVPLTITSSEKPLPPLVIDREMVKSKVNQVHL